MILLHGTTRARAERILHHGPDPISQEPGGQAWEDGFSMNVETGPFDFGAPEDYARGKGVQTRYCAATLWNSRAIRRRPMQGFRLRQPFCPWFRGARNNGFGPAAEDRVNLSVLHDLLAVLASPYAARAGLARYQGPPPDECGYRTFCGT